jgi:serine/threonine-protein kinase
MQDVDWSQLRETALASFTLAALPPTLQLPALPLAVTRFLEKARFEDASLKELAAVLETDAGLTLELLKHVNSTFVGLRQKAKTVQQAMSLLGLRQTKLLVISAGAQAAVKSRKSKLLNQTCFWNSCLQRAIFAREIARLLGADTEIAFAGALLQDFLLPVVTNDLFEQYLHFSEHRSQQPECLCQFERQNFGWDHALAGACLAHRWKLPDELVCCILLHHHGLHILADPDLSRTPVAAVVLSALLPDQLRQHYTGLEQLALLQQKWPAFDLRALVEIVDHEHPSAGMGVGNDFPLLRRCKPVLLQDNAAAELPV